MAYYEYSERNLLRKNVKLFLFKKGASIKFKTVVESEASGLLRNTFMQQQLCVYIYIYFYICTAIYAYMYTYTFTV